VDLGRLAGGGGVDWIQLAQDRGRWRALVNTAMNLRVLAPRSYLYQVSANVNLSIKTILMVGST
jgi:hypothetical protein